MNRMKIRNLAYVAVLGASLAIGCGNVEVQGENTADACSDGIDNDTDGKIDCVDAECKVAFFDTLCQDTGTGGNSNGGAGGTGGTGGQGGEAPCENDLCPSNCEIDDCQPGAGGSGGDFGGECATPDPFLPYPSGQHMGVTQGPGCNGHTGKLAEAYDFNINGETYESSANMTAVAATSGTVVKVVQSVTGGCYGCSGSTYNYGWGNCVIVQIDNSCLYDRYCHLRHNGALVKEGDHVCPGQPLGYIGSTGNSTGDHLHYQRETANGWSVKIPKFQETTVASGCTPCATPSHLSGCYESTNAGGPGCSVPPPSPCQGLASGKYCGSNPQLDMYPGSPNDLVNCQGGQIASTEYCSLGCEIKPPGQNDVCKQNGACGASGQMCCNGTTCNAPLQCNGGICTCTPDCTNKCGGASDGCGGFCNGSCGAGTTCSNQSCEPCGANAQVCCNGTSCNAPLQCNAGFCGCTPNCSNKCGGAPNGCGGFCNGSCGAGTTCSNQSCEPCGANAQVCCNGTSCNAPLQCNGGFCSCTPNCTNKCGGAPDGCGGFCNGTCGAGTTCSNQSCVPCGASGQVCCNGTSCNAPLQCNGGTCGCTPNCSNKCGGASDGCGGFCNGSCGGGTTCSNQSCVPCGASGQVCCNGTSCNAPLQCNGGTCFSCGIGSSPSIGTFTPAFVGNTNCTCASNNPQCHAIYQGKVVSISADKWHANLAFRKFDGGTISAGIKYWVVVGDFTNPSCVDLNAFVVRTSGTVASNTTELVIPSVAIWPDQTTFDNDTAGTTKKIFLITDGQGSPNLKTWFEKDALVFTKTCP